jgi:thiamine-phosphate pyrophosphorylase
LTATPRVYVIVDVAGARALADLRVRASVAVQLRDRAASGRALLTAATHLREAGHRVYVNDRVDVALAAACEGVHLRTRSVGVAEARTLAAGRLRVAVSLHSIDEVTAARAAGADFCVFGPVFETPGAGKSPPVGLAQLGAAAGVASPALPVLALGGVNVANAASCLAAGAQGLAAIRAGRALAEAFG